MRAKVREHRQRQEAEALLRLFKSTCNVLNDYTEAVVTGQHDKHIPPALWTYTEFIAEHLHYLETTFDGDDRLMLVQSIIVAIIATAEEAHKYDLNSAKLTPCGCSHNLSDDDIEWLARASLNLGKPDDS